MCRVGCARVAASLAVAPPGSCCLLIACLPACLLRLKAGPVVLPRKLTYRPLATPTFPPLPQALRLFVGVPVWTPHNRPADDMPSRSKYLQAVGHSAVAAA
jgi:hypothetical protein